MLDKLEKDIGLSEEVLNGLPVNNDKNKRKLIEEIDLEINNYQKRLDDIVLECKRRLSGFENISYEEVSDNKKAISTLKNILKYTNNLSTSYEKLDLDKLIYQLSHFQDDDLINNNRKILILINTFKSASIVLTHKDFNYTNFVYEYMKMFFEGNLSISRIKEVFDDIYWRCPNIMLQIELNFRHLYIKNKKKMDAYFASFSKRALDRFVNGEESIVNDYNYLRRKDEDFISKNNLILDFYNQKMDIDEYSDESVSNIKSKYFKNDLDNMDTVFELLECAREYKEYLKYSSIIDKIKELYNESIEKDYLDKSIKKVEDLEKKLFKLCKKSSVSFEKTKVSNVDPEINNLISQIKGVYDEIDSNIFKVIVKEHIKENSTIFKAFLLVCQYYVVLASFYKENGSMSYSEIDKMIDELYDFTMNPKNTLINNITAISDRNISDIIITNYRMHNVSIDESMLSLDSIDGLIGDLNKIIVNYRLKKLGISIEKLINAKKVRSALEKNNAM